MVKTIFPVHLFLKIFLSFGEKDLVHQSAALYFVSRYQTSYIDPANDFQGCSLLSLVYRFSEFLSQAFLLIKNIHNSCYTC